MTRCRLYGRLYGKRLMLESKVMDAGMGIESDSRRAWIEVSEMEAGR